MVKVKKCSFCGYDIPIGRGVMIRNDGRILTFCSNKCRKTMVVHKKKARRTRWTAHYGKQ